MPTVSTLLLFAGASLLLLVLPGPAVIYVVTRSVEQGRRAGLVSVLGLELGTFVYALTTALGIAGAARRLSHGVRGHPLRRRRLPAVRGHPQAPRPDH